MMPVNIGMEAESELREELFSSTTLEILIEENIKMPKEEVLK